jgi:hypothetical protein
VADLLGAHTRALDGGAGHLGGQVGQRQVLERTAKPPMAERTALTT